MQFDLLVNIEELFIILMSITSGFTICNERNLSLQYSVIFLNRIFDYTSKSTWDNYTKIIIFIFKRNHFKISVQDAKSDS